VQKEGDEPGDNCSAELKTGSEAGARRERHSIRMDLKVSKDSDPWNVTGPNTKGVVSTHSGYSSEFSSMRGVLFGTLNTLYFQQNTSPYISIYTDTTMTRYETGGTKISEHHSMFVFW
jgi:hypothetical protein